MQHGDKEDRDSRWARDGMSKRDIDPLIGATRQVTERLPKPNEDQLAFELDGGHPEDDRANPPKPDVTRPPESRKGAKRDERVPIPEDLHGRLWHLLTLEEKLAARQRMTDAEIAAWAKASRVRNTMTPSEEAKWAAGLAS